jgi:hypothetical protein
MPFEQAVLQAKTNLTLRFSDAVMFRQALKMEKLKIY